MSKTNPTREDFAALLEESFVTNDLAEGSVVRGRIIAIEKDMVVIDAGLKVEGRVALKEFGAQAKDGSLKPGAMVTTLIPQGCISRRKLSR